jgi:hypothetical protein
MAFGKKATADEPGTDPAGRFIVEHVPVMISGKKLVQSELDKGDAKGYELRHLLMSDKHDWVLVVWERPKLD